MWIGVYDNRSAEGGYGFYALSGGFPGSIEDSILQIMCRWGKMGEAPGKNLRFSELSSDSCYLFSFIHRNVTDEFCFREHFQAVHYVVTPEEADYILHYSFRDVYQRFESLSAELVSKQAVPDRCEDVQYIFGSFPEERRAHQRIPDRELLESLMFGAFYGRDRKNRTGQVIIAGADPIKALTEVFARLPDNLRKTVSFQTNIESCGEAYGIALAFCSEKAFDEMKMAGFEKRESTNLSYYYRGKLSVNSSEHFGKELSMCLLSAREEEARNYANETGNLSWDEYIRVLVDGVPHIKAFFSRIRRCFNRT